MPVVRHPAGGRDTLDVSHLLGRPALLVVVPEPPKNRVVGCEEPFDLCPAIVAGIRMCHRSLSPAGLHPDSMVFRAVKVVADHSARENVVRHSPEDKLGALGAPLACLVRRRVRAIPARTRAMPASMVAVTVSLRTRTPSTIATTGRR